MKLIPLDRDAIDRTLLVGMVAGTQPSHEEAALARARFGIQITVDDLATVAHQAALLGAVASAARAAGVVAVAAPTSELGRTVLGGSYKNLSIRDAIAAEGAQVGLATAPTLVQIAIGATTSPTEASTPVLHATWDGWTARVNGLTFPPASGDETNVLAAIAASALAVHEAFGIFSSPAGRDDGHRDLELNLWKVEGSTETGPALRWAPSAWWLVGLGHLGQANAWVLSWLGLPSGTEVVLQDDALLSDANHSTGLLTPVAPRHERKVRAVARALESSGLTTRLVEQRFTGEPVVENHRAHFALFGVDKPGPRRRISAAQWAHVIDVGIGTGPDDFDSLLLHRFPAAGDSNIVAAWQGQAGDIRIPDTPAFARLSETHEECGVIELAGTAVGASFVGLLAAAVSVAEAARSLHGGAAHDVTRIDLGHWKVRAATTAREQCPMPAAISLPKRLHRAGR